MKHIYIGIRSEGQRQREWRKERKRERKREIVQMAGMLYMKKKMLLACTYGYVSMTPWIRPLKMCLCWVLLEMDLHLHWHVLSLLPGSQTHTIFHSSSQSLHCADWKIATVTSPATWQSLTIKGQIRGFLTIDRQGRHLAIKPKHMCACVCVCLCVCSWRWQRQALLFFFFWLRCWRRVLQSRGG